MKINWKADASNLASGLTLLLIIVAVFAVL